MSVWRTSEKSQTTPSNDVHIAVSPEVLKTLNPPARSELARCVTQFSLDLLAEAGRLEANANTARGRPEITTSMVRDADILLRHRYVRPHQSWSSRILKLTAVVSGILTGLMADAAFLKELSHLVLFIFGVVVTVASTVWSFKD